MSRAPGGSCGVFPPAPPDALAALRCPSLCVRRVRAPGLRAAGGVGVRFRAADAAVPPADARVSASARSARGVRTRPPPASGRPAREAPPAAPLAPGPLAPRGRGRGKAGGGGKSGPAEDVPRTHAPPPPPGFGGRRGRGGGAGGARSRVGGALGGAWAAHPAPPWRGADARGGGLQGNRIQQFQPRGRPEASRRPPDGMCAAEVDHHVAQRYLLKRRLGKGVSPATCGAGAGPVGGLFSPTLPGVLGSLPVFSTDWRVALRKPPSPSGLSFL